jgi:hypothetical protein
MVGIADQSCSFNGSTRMILIQRSLVQDTSIGISLCRAVVCPIRSRLAGCGRQNEAVQKSQAGELANKANTRRMRWKSRKAAKQAVVRHTVDDSHRAALYRWLSIRASD